MKVSVFKQLLSACPTCRKPMAVEQRDYGLFREAYCPRCMKFWEMKLAIDMDINELVWKPMTPPPYLSHLVKKEKQ